MKALAKLGALLVLCAVLTGVSVTNNNVVPEAEKKENSVTMANARTQITLDADKVAHISFCVDRATAGTADLRGVSDSTAIEQIVGALNELELWKLEGVQDTPDMNIENIGMIVVVHYFDQDIKQKTTMPDEYIFCKDDIVVVSQGNQAEQYYKTDGKKLLEVLYKVQIDYPDTQQSRTAEK